MSRDDFFAAIFLVGCVNGLAARVIDSIAQQGWSGAILSTFETSLVVWIACYVGIALISRDSSDKTHRWDHVVGFFALALMSVPVGGLNWVGITVLALYVILCAKPSSTRSRGAIILLATTCTMLWGRLAFAFFADPILKMDAQLTAWLKGTERIGNMVHIADGSGYLAILPACSSFANVSLAILAWVIVIQSLARPLFVRDFLWCGLACASVIAVNAGRLSIMASNMNGYLAGHSEWGAAIANVLTLVVIIGITTLCARRGPLAYV
jgi:hypothetical protein